MQSPIIDPVCGMVVTDGRLHTVFHGGEYSFCAERCKAKFRKSPEEYSRDDIYDLIIIPGEERLLRKGLSHSAVQDAALLEGAEVVVVGGGNSGIQAAKELLNAKQYLARSEETMRQ